MKQLTFFDLLNFISLTHKYYRHTLGITESPNILRLGV
jgi:hypothetical protein